MSTEALLARLRADERFDAAVLRMGEADYGCEERPDDADADANAEKFAEIDEFKHVSGQKETEAAREFHAETAILG